MLSVAAFMLTSTTPAYLYLGPLCAQDVAPPAFDPWTGRPHGRIYDVADCLADPTGAPANLERIVNPVPDELQGRRAVPLPAGFAVGSVITIGTMAAMSRRRRVEPTGPSAMVT